MIEDSDIGTPREDALPGNGAAESPTAEVAPAAVATAGAPGGAVSGQTMTITFKLYATLQDLLPGGAVKNAVSIDVAKDTSLNDLIDRFKVPRELAHLVLVNGVFVCDADRDARGALVPGDVLAIWPPVAGG